MLSTDFLSTLKDELDEEETSSDDNADEGKKKKKGKKDKKLSIDLLDNFLDHLDKNGEAKTEKIAPESARALASSNMDMDVEDIKHSKKSKKDKKLAIDLSDDFLTSLDEDISDDEISGIIAENKTDNDADTVKRKKKKNAYVFILK